MRFFICSIFFVLISSCNLNDQVELGQGFILKNSTPTINTIGKSLDDDAGGQVRFIRGDIERYYFDSKIIAGYLSTKKFSEDGLIGLESDNDKEGFFVIFKSTETIFSGLKREQLREKLKEELLGEEVDFIENS